MPTKIELQFASAVQKAVADVKKVESEFKTLSGDAKSVSGALANVATAGQSMGGAGAAVAAGMQVARTGLAAMAQAAQAGTMVLGMLVGAFDQAEKAAERYGNVKVADQIDRMKTSVDNAIGALVDLPIAGKNVLQWMGDAADGAGNLAKLMGALAIQFELVTGQITQQEAATKVAKLANDGYSQSMDDLYEKAKRNNVFFEANQNKGILLNGVRITGAASMSDLPGRAVGGPVSAGRLYLVGERGPETFVPNSNGTIVPNGAGGGNVTVNVSVNAGAFMGDRADAMRLANELAPLIARASQRGAKA